MAGESSEKPDGEIVMTCAKCHSGVKHRKKNPDKANIPYSPKMNTSQHPGEIMKSNVFCQFLLQRGPHEEDKRTKGEGQGEKWMITEGPQDEDRRRTGELEGDKGGSR